MEEQVVSLYMKLKNNQYKNIIVSYFEWPNKYKTEEVKLINVQGFSYITISNSRYCTDLYFFGYTSLIESITICGETQPIYFNRYAKKITTQQEGNPTKIIEKIKTDFLSSTNIDEIITPRESFLSKYYDNKFFTFNDLFFSDKQRQNFKEIFNLLATELINYAASKGLNTKIELIARGSTSFVYCIGDKILKIGKPRQKTTIPYCEYLLQPIINKDMMFDGIPMHIEVTQKVISYRDLNEKWLFKFKIELFKLQRALHAIGLYCSDLHKGNIGILTQDNVIHFDPIYFQTGNEEATSIRNNNNLVVRKKGDFVIIDLDYIEIINIHRYCKYLAKIGYDTEKIEEIKKAHGIKVKRK